MTSPEALYGRWINELWAGKHVAAEIVTDDFVGHWPDTSMIFTGNDILRIEGGRLAEYWTGTSTG